MSLPLNQVICGYAIEAMRTFSPDLMDCVLTSPPCFGLRDYGEDVARVWDGDSNCEHEWGDRIIVRSYGNVGSVPQVGNQVSDTMKGSEKQRSVLSEMWCLERPAWS